MKSEFRSLMTEKQGRRGFLTAATLAILSAGAIGTSQAKGPPAPSPMLTFSISDLAGDQRGGIDVTGMVMTFEQKHGNYTITLTADPAHPFVGQFRVDINLFNATRISLFSDICSQCDVFGIHKNPGNDFDLSTPTTTLTLTGKDPTLLGWQAGDQVATHSLGTGGGPLGNPPGASLFRSSVASLPLTFLDHEDVIGVNDQSWNGSYMTDTSGAATIN